MNIKKNSIKKNPLGFKYCTHIKRTKTIFLRTMEVHGFWANPCLFGSPDPPIPPCSHICTTRLCSYRLLHYYRGHWYIRWHLKKDKIQRIITVYIYKLHTQSHTNCVWLYISIPACTEHVHIIFRLLLYVFWTLKNHCAYKCNHHMYK